MSAELNTPIRTIEWLLAELAEGGFIRRIRRSQKYASTVLLPHPALRSDPQPIADHDPQDPVVRSARSCGSDPQPVADQPEVYISRARSGKRKKDVREEGERARPSASLNSPHGLGGNGTQKAAAKMANWDALLAAYPNPCGVERACQWYVSEMGQASDPAKLHMEIMAGVERYLASAKWRDRETGELDGQWIPGLDAFLGVPRRAGEMPTRMYLDYPAAWKAKTRKPTHEEKREAEMAASIARLEELDRIKEQYRHGRKQAES